MTRLLSRERVMKAINHEETDRVPIDISGTVVSGVHKYACKHLAEHLGFSSDLEEFELIQQLGKVDQRILDRFGNDCSCLLPGSPTTWSLGITKDENASYFTDEWGTVFKKPDRGFYFDPYKNPLSQAKMNDLKGFPWPDGRDPGRKRGLRARAERAFKDTQYALVMTEGSWGINMQAMVLLGFERYYDCVVTDLRFLRAVLERTFQFQFEYWDSILSEVKDYVQIVQLEDDLGTQFGPLINPKTYRELVKPLHRSLIEHIKKVSKAKVFFHSCGAVSTFIPDFIEIGVDILNPVQVSAEAMDSKRLKQEFGKDLTFWGGGCDTQKTLPRGTPEDVRKEVRRRISDFAPGGGFVFCPVHNVQPEVPPENLVALYEAALEYGRYPIEFS